MEYDYDEGLDSSKKTAKCHRCKLTYDENLPICPKCNDLSDQEASNLKEHFYSDVQHRNRTLRIPFFVGAIVCFCLILFSLI